MPPTISGRLLTGDSMGKYRKELQDKMELIGAINDVKASYKMKEYGTWFCMLKRVHQDIYELNDPNYKNTKVVSEWYIFSNYLKWVKENNPSSKLVIDKDLIGANIYGPNTCVCISQKLNNALQLGNTNNGCVMGVRKTPNNKFNARVRKHYAVQSKTFNREKDAGNWYKIQKAHYLRSLALEELDIRIPHLVNKYISRHLS